MIARHWTGVVRGDRAADYVAHLKHDTFEQLAGIDGFLDAAILRRPVEDGIEFRIITEWATLDAIREFAGTDFETAVVPDVAQAMMVRFDGHVTHYEVVSP